MNDVVLEYVVSPPLSNSLYFFNSSFKDLTINKKLDWLDNLLFIEADKKIYLGLTPLQIKSDIEERIIFFIIKSGFLVFLKWIFSLYVSVDTTRRFFLSKKTSSFSLRELGLLAARYFKYFDIILSSSIGWSYFFRNLIK